MQPFNYIKDVEKVIKRINEKAGENPDTLLLTRILEEMNRKKIDEQFNLKNVSNKMGLQRSISGLLKSCLMLPIRLSIKFWRLSIVSAISASLAASLNRQ